MKKKSITIALLLGIAVVRGYTSPEKPVKQGDKPEVTLKVSEGSWSRLREGMSVEEVTRILGKGRLGKAEYAYGEQTVLQLFYGQREVTFYKKRLKDWKPRNGN